MTQPTDFYDPNNISTTRTLGFYDQQRVGSIWRTGTCGDQCPAARAGAHVAGWLVGRLPIVGPYIYIHTRATVSACSEC